jgi:uncharacterized membrane protein
MQYHSDHYGDNDNDLASRPRSKLPIGVTLALLGGAAFIAVRAIQAQKKSSGHSGIERVLAMQVSMHDIYTFFRHPERFPQVMPFLESIRMEGDEAIWSAKIGDKLTGWRMRLEEDRPSEHIVWNAVPDASLKLRLEVSLEPLPTGRGNAVRLKVDSDTMAQSLFGGVAKRVVQDVLLKTRALLEAGEVPTTEGQPHGGKSKMPTDAASSAADGVASGAAA